MSNTVPATAFPTAPVTPAAPPVAPLPLAAEAQIARPQLTVVAPTTAPETAQKVQEAPVPAVTPGIPPAAQAADVPPELPELLKLYRAQQRECWLCKKIAGAIDSGKEPSEDDRWHFTTCVLSWAHI